MDESFFFLYKIQSQQNHRLFKSINLIWGSCGQDFEIHAIVLIFNAKIYVQNISRPVLLVLVSFKKIPNWQHCEGQLYRSEFNLLYIAYDIRTFTNNLWYSFKPILNIFSRPLIPTPGSFCLEGKKWYILLSVNVRFQSWARIWECLRSPGIDSASLCSLAGWYDNPICFTGPLCCSTYIGGLDSLESIPELLKRLQIRALVCYIV